MSLQMEVAFGAAEVLQHWAEVSPGLSLCNGQAWPGSGAWARWATLHLLSPR